MPDRILRPGIFDSEKYLALGKSALANTARACYFPCLPVADIFGNLSAGPNFLEKLWRHTGVETPEAIDAVLYMLADVRLIGIYECDGDRYLHIFRFRQSTKYLGRLFCPHPDADVDEKGAFLKKNKQIAASNWITLKPITYKKVSGASPKGSASGSGSGSGSVLVSGSTKAAAAKVVRKRPPVDNSAKAGKSHSYNPPYPDWWPLPEWEAFRDMRVAIKHPMTDRAQDLMVAKLTAMREKHDPVELLNRSTVNNWRDVFAPDPARVNGNGHHGAPPENWWSSEEATLAKAKELGLPIGRGSYADLRKRIADRLKQQNRPT